MAESFNTRLMRWGFNFFPAYRRTGARLTYIAHDLKEVRIKLPLNWQTRNYVGTIFGGSMYGAVDPIYLVMLIKLLGRGYIVWDKNATIRYKKPGRRTLSATFKLDDEELDQIRSTLQTNRSVERVYAVELADEKGVVHAMIDKTVHIQRKDRRAQVQGAQTG